MENNKNKMRKLKALILLLAVAVLVSNVALAVEPQVPKIAANAYILIDFNSEKVIAEKNSKKRVEPASLTKMMSAYVIENELKLGNINMTDEVLISKKAWKMPGSRMFVEVNTRVSVENLLKGIIIQSGNDATVAMAEYIAGSEESFVSLMNEHARQLGMNDTNFVNSTGLPHKQHYTTATDLATLVAAMIRNFPEHYSWYSEKVFTYNGIKQYNRNKLLWQDKYVDGVKTGHTESAGFCLAASAVRDGMRLISVVVGTKSERARATESQKLLTFGFRFYETHRLYEANNSLTTAHIWKGAQDKLPLGLAEDLWITIPRGSYGSLKATMSLDTKIVAPAKRGGVYGAVNVKLEGKPQVSRDLVALKDVPEGSFVGGILDEVEMLFE